MKHIKTNFKTHFKTYIVPFIKRYFRSFIKGYIISFIKRYFISFIKRYIISFNMARQTQGKARFGKGIQGRPNGTRRQHMTRVWMLARDCKVTHCKARDGKVRHG